MNICYVLATQNLNGFHICQGSQSWDKPQGGRYFFSQLLGIKVETWPWLADEMLQLRLRICLSEVVNESGGHQGLFSGTVIGTMVRRMPGDYGMWWDSSQSPDNGITSNILHKLCSGALAIPSSLWPLSVFPSSIFLSL